MIRTGAQLDDPGTDDPELDTLMILDWTLMIRTGHTDDRGLDTRPITGLGYSDDDDHRGRVRRLSTTNLRALGRSLYGEVLTAFKPGAALLDISLVRTGAKATLIG